MNRKHILIAEDELAYGKILKDSLEKEGYDVVTTLNGEELMRQVRKRESALVILDMIMPLKNGYQVLSEMKKDTRLKHIKVMALSNLGQEEDIEKAKTYGADAYVVKSDETLSNVLSKIKILAQ